MSQPRVYSYRRFSSERQAQGHSLERQTAAARVWCQENGHVLDEDLALSDLGISAFKGKNATEGALAAFLIAAKEGRIPRGSILLVESLDRLSRNTITDAVALLTSIVRAGIRVVSLIDGKEWNENTINDTVNFMMSVLLFARAHEESATKARRVRAAFAKKREAKLPVVSHGHGPGWAYPREDRQGWLLDEANLYPDSVASKGICWLGSCTVPVGNACKRSPHGSVAVRGTTVWVESQGLAPVRPSVRLQSSISGSPAWPLLRQASFRKPRHFD